MGSRNPLRHIPEAPRFTVGRDHHGWWIVHDRLDKVGGMFSTETAALHFAFEESHYDRCGTDLVSHDNLVEMDAFLTKPRASGLSSARRRA